MTRILSVFNFLKRVGFALLFALGTTQTAQAQDWETPIRLTDWFIDGSPHLVVDSLYRIHLFTIRSRSQGIGQPNTLTYSRFDNWGRPIAEPVELVPDTHWTEYPSIGVLIDNLDRIHVVWYRQFNNEEDNVQLVYCRLSNEGEFLQEPYIYEVPGNLPGGIQADTYHLVETTTGEIWAACGGHYFAFDINGNLIEPVQQVFPNTNDASIRMAAGPDGSVWGTCRKYDTNSDTLKTIRFWPPPRVEETTLVSNSPGFGPQAFAIDQYGSFHYVIYTDENALFYRFDPRGMGPIIETVIDPSPYGVGISNLIPIGLDSLQFMWGQTLPPPHGINRVCFTLDGNVGFGPMLIPQQNFEISDYSGMWRDGGYWIPGGMHGAAMLHIPGPNEPLALNERPTEHASQPSLHVYPQPNFGTLYFNLPTSMKGETNLIIYNILGQQVYQTDLQAPPAAGFPGVMLPSALATGSYLLSLSTQSQFMTTRFILIK